MGGYSNWTFVITKERCYTITDSSTQGWHLYQHVLSRAVITAKGIVNSLLRVWHQWSACAQQQHPVSWHHSITVPLAVKVVVSNIHYYSVQGQACQQPPQQSPQPPPLKGTSSQQQKTACSEEEEDKEEEDDSGVNVGENWTVCVSKLTVMVMTRLIVTIVTRT